MYWLSKNIEKHTVQVVAAKRILENKYNIAQQASDDWSVLHVFFVLI